jgi:hypothetical protein
MNKLITIALTLLLTASACSAQFIGLGNRKVFTVSGGVFGTQDIFIPMSTGSGAATTTNLGSGTKPSGGCSWSLTGRVLSAVL